MDADLLYEEVYDRCGEMVKGRTFDEWTEILCEYCDTHNNTNIGSWLSNQKKKINATTDSTYQKLTMNPLVQKCLDTYLIKKQKRMSHATGYHTFSSHKYTIASMW